MYHWVQSPAIPRASLLARLLLWEPGKVEASGREGRFQGRHVKQIRFAGVGSFVPKNTVSNERIAQAIPGWPAERIEEKLGIHERRFLWEFDERTGKAIPPPDDAQLYPACNVDMCEVALREALAMGGVAPGELDAVFVVTCSPDQVSFNHDAMAVHQRLGCRQDTFALVIDDGCGGTPYVIDLARRMLEGGTFKTIAVVASSFTSPYLNREVFTSELELASGKKLSGILSMYVFGDGASAVVLRAAEADGSPSGLVASLAGNAHDQLVIHRAGGALNLPFQGRTQPADHAFIVDGLRVARSYPVFMRRCLEEVTGGDPAVLAQVKRFYFHQPNRRLMDRFIQDQGLAPEKVACHVDRYGNTSAAGMMTLLAEDLRQGVVRLGSGDLVLVAAVGANVHYGAQLVRL